MKIFIIITIPIFPEIATATDLNMINIILYLCIPYKYFI
jgi:hypothetical protein